VRGVRGIATPGVSKRGIARPGIARRGVTRLIETLDLYRAFAGASLRARMQYRASFLLGNFALILTNIVQFIYIWAVLYRFGTIHGWNFGQVTLLYALSMLSGGVFTIFFRQFVLLQQLVQSGRLDQYYTRPAGLFFQVLTSGLDLDGLGNIIAGLACLYFAAVTAPIQFTAARSAFLVLFVLSGAAIKAGIAVALASTSFWIVESEPLMTMVMQHLAICGWQFPISVYGRFIQYLLTFLFPYAFCNFFPAQAILGKNDFTFFHPVFAYLSPFVGVAVFCIGYVVWRVGILRYQSTGS